MIVQLNGTKYVQIYEAVGLRAHIVTPVFGAFAPHGTTIIDD